VESVGQFYVRTTKGRRSPSQAHVARNHRGAGVHHAVQPVPVRPDQRLRRPGFSSAQAMKALEDSSPGPCRGRWVRLPRDVVQEQQAQKGSPRRYLRLLDAVRLPDPGGPVRELVAPVQRLLGPLAVPAPSAPSCAGPENNVYAQIGLVMLIGLAAKNAI